MRFILLYFYALLVTSPVSAGLDGPRRGFTVNQIEGRGVHIPLPVAYVQALAKHGGSAPADISAAAAIESKKYSERLRRVGRDILYYGAVSFGTPPRRLNLQFDTGSADTWGYTKEIPVKDRQGHSYWTPKRSNTSILVNRGWAVAYADGNYAVGSSWTDTLKIASAVVPSVGLGGATALPSSNTFRPQIDGILGLSNRRLTTFKKSTLMTALSRSLPRNIFAMALKYRAAGSIDFGYLNHSKYRGMIQYTSLNNLLKNNYTKGRYPNAWFVDVASVKIGNTAHNLTIDHCAVDSGTTLLLVAGDLPSLFYAQIPSAQLTDGAYTFPCSDRHIVPDLSLDFFHEHSTRKFTVTIPGSQLTFEPTSQNASLCYGMLQQSNGLTILGDPLLKGQYVVFDHDSGRLGFAPQVVY